MDGLDPALVLAWLTGRSVARGLPAPVADRGGFRVDTGSGTETRRWVFARARPEILDLAREIERPTSIVKLCGTVDALASLLPGGWRATATGWVMSANGDRPRRPLPAGYRIDGGRDAGAINLRILSLDGEIAASGWAAETEGTFVYDRIVTDAAHRRRGLGGALMSALGEFKREKARSELLVATDDGRALYETLGWRVLSPYSTASIDDRTITPRGAC